MKHCSLIGQGERVLGACVRVSLGVSACVYITAFFFFVSQFTLMLERGRQTICLLVVDDGSITQKHIFHGRFEKQYFQFKGNLGTCFDEPLIDFHLAVGIKH